MTASSASTPTTMGSALCATPRPPSPRPSGLGTAGSPTAGNEPGPDVAGHHPNSGPNKVTGSSTTQATGYSRRTDGRGRMGGAPPNRSTSALGSQAQRGQDRQLPPHQIFTGNCRYFRPYFHHQFTQMGYDQLLGSDWEPTHAHARHGTGPQQGPDSSSQPGK